VQVRHQYVIFSLGITNAAAIGLSLRSEESQINSAIKSFKLRRNSIIKEIKQMNKEINNSIINPIKTGRYRTTCDKCCDVAISPKPFAWCHRTCLFDIMTTYTFSIPKFPGIGVGMATII
jgi:hypothetical protein